MNPSDSIAGSTKDNQRGHSAHALPLSYLLGARLIILLLSLGASGFNLLASEIDHAHKFTLLYAPVVICLLLTAFSALWIRRRTPSSIFTYSQLALDVLLVTGIIYVTGGAISPFLFLYLPLVMASVILVSRTGAFIISFMSACAYIALVFALQSGALLPADGGTQAFFPHGGLFTQIVGLGSAMILIAVATNFLQGAVRKAHLQVKQSQLDLSNLKDQQSTLMNSIPRGIVTTSAEGSIVSINQAAQELLQVDEGTYLNRRLEELFSQLDPHAEFNLSFGSKKEFEGDLKVALPGGDGFRSISYHGRPIVSAEGDSSGLIFVVQDMTKIRSIEEQLELQERMARIQARSESSNYSGATRQDNFVGESSIMKKIFGLIERVAPSDATVLVNGESGTGKELVARAIHHGSTRKGGPFVPVNCGAIPESLIESELFGHKRGAFTGAVSDHAGLFRQAEGGTLFLDEIGELPLSMQTKLLRALQEKSIRAVGGERDTPIDVRIVAATNRNLKQEIQSGNFREDLFYRLNVISLNLPPLRERREDIPLLVDFIVRRLCRNTTLPLITPQTMQLLVNYNYPGNVRELENILERAIVLGGDALLPEHLPETLRTPAPPPSSAAPSLASGGTQIVIDERLDLPVNLDSILSNLERKYLEIALLRTNGAKKKAASLLGMNFRSFRYRLQKFDISEDSPESGE